MVTGSDRRYFTTSGCRGRKAQRHHGREFSRDSHFSPSVVAVPFSPPSADSIETRRRRFFVFEHRASAPAAPSTRLEMTGVSFRRCSERTNNKGNRDSSGPRGASENTELRRRRQRETPPAPGVPSPCLHLFQMQRGTASGGSRRRRATPRRRVRQAGRGKRSAQVSAGVLRDRAEPPAPAGPAPGHGLVGCDLGRGRRRGCRRPVRLRPRHFRIATGRETCRGGNPVSNREAHAHPYARARPHTGRSAGAT